MNKNFLSTLILLGLNLIVFAWLAIQQQSLMMSSSLDVLGILHAGANFNPFTLGSEPWRIIASMFLHFGVIHLLANMYALYSLGKILEPSLGTPRFLVIYFICGIAAGLASLFFNIYAISAGASGAIFGLYGYLLGAEVIGNFHDRERLISIIVNFVIFVAINAFFTSFFRVDLSGHIGGCMAGVILTVLHHKFGLLTGIKGLSIALVLVFSSMWVLPNGQLHYYRIFQRVLKAERHTNQLYRNSLNDVQLKDSLTAVLSEWDDIKSSLQTLGSVPAQLTTDTAHLSAYVTLHKQETYYRVSLIERESFVYLDSLEIISLKFDSLPPFDYSLNYSLPEEFIEDKKDTADRSTPALTTKRIFYNVDWKPVDDPSISTYYRIGAVDSLGRWQGQVRDHFRNGDIQMKGKYFNGMKDGVFLYYSEQGTYSSAGRYAKEEAIGKWENFHFNGALHTEVYYNEGEFTRTVWDSLGRAQVINGKGKARTWYANGQVAEEGNYDGGRKEGDWFGFHENGKPYYHEFYRDNRLIRGASEDQNGKRYVYDQLSLYPFPIIGMTEYKKYLDKNMRKPASSKFETGMVKVIFNVGLDGSVWDFVVMQSVSLPFDQEAIRLIEQGPAWRPGLLHGHIKLPSQGYVEVPF